MWDVVSLTVRTLGAFAVAIVLFNPLYFYSSQLHERYGEVEFQASTRSEQFISVALAVAPFFIFNWIRKRLKSWRHTFSKS